MFQPKVEEIIKDLPKLLTSFLEEEIKAEKREQLSNIECEVNEIGKLTKCWVLASLLSDDDEIDADYDVLSSKGGYDIADGVYVPISIYWLFNEKKKAIEIEIVAKWDEIQIKEVKQYE